MSSNYALQPKLRARLRLGVMQKISMPKTIHLVWTPYPDFFKLYEKKKSVPKLIYVIGLTKLVYVGNVGSNGGENGLARRYDEQYVLRAASIFGSNSPKAQRALQENSETCQKSVSMMY